MIVPDATAEPAAPSPSGRAPAAWDLDFEEFYAAHFHHLALQLGAYLGDLVEAQDMVQEAFCRALPRWRKISSYDNPVAWVRRVAWNLATSRLRRQKIALRHLLGQRERSVSGPNPDHVALVVALASLPEPHRRAVVLHYLADLSVAEIAAQEGVAAGTVKSWLSRGRAALAGKLAFSERGQDSE